MIRYTHYCSWSDWPGCKLLLEDELRSLGLSAEILWCIAPYEKHMQWVVYYAPVDERHPALMALRSLTTPYDDDDDPPSPAGEGLIKS